MANNVYFCFSILLSLLFISCSSDETSSESSLVESPYAHIADSSAVSILHKASEAAGSLDRWYAKKSISFYKSYQLLLEDGTVEQEANQYHTYISQPDSKISISWEKNQVPHVIEFIDNNPQKYVNGILDTTVNEQSLMNTVLSSTFVADLPFRVIGDKGADISYAGKDTLENNRTVECIQVKYYPDEYEHHSSEDVWNLYFDEESYYLVGYMVKHDDHISYVKNTKDTIIDGFYFVIDRESYRVTEDREPLYLRAVYHYEDYQIQF